MREYLFRGKRLSDGKWCEGFLTVVFEHTYIGKANEDENCFRFLVDPETVGQFTGMKDRNGKEIFEGDICRVCLDPEICTAHIQYDERTASFNMRYNKFQCNTFLDMRLAENRVGDRVWIEVIGNIHDNPELLEG